MEEFVNKENFKETMDEVKGEIFNKIDDINTLIKRFKTIAKEGNKQSNYDFGLELDKNAQLND